MRAVLWIWIRKFLPDPEKIIPDWNEFGKKII
jgi:hypothetical protein